MQRVGVVAGSGACGERLTVRGVTERKRMPQTARCRRHLTAIHRIARVGPAPVIELEPRIRVDMVADANV